MTLRSLFKEHAMTLGIWAVTTGSWFGSMTITIRWIDSRLTKLEEQHVEQLRWQVDSDAKSIVAMQTDLKMTTVTVQQIYTQQAVQSQQLGEINKKLDDHR